MSKLRLLDIGSANPRLEEGWNRISDIEIIMFEPDERSYNDLIKNKHNDSYTVFNYALSSKNETRKLYLTKKPECTSLYKPNMKYHNKFPNAQRWEIIKTIDVECKSLKNIYKEVCEYDFIKIDTQGSELDILQGSIGGGLETTLGIESEVEFLELYEGQPLFGDMCKFMIDNGFEFYDFIVEYRYGRRELNRKGQLAFADALFLRTPEWICNNFLNKTINENKVRKYIEICSVYGKLDLIEVILEKKLKNN
ncbi:FkbM family methyltransferase [Aliarcobacter skirrowii]|uniref:FkbM family methyltransferase n=1 Tax=Aliarcobacter skirrowii TaxID=28200 RepID=UPI0029A3C36D|nr:FkbM family methyltransferase [Aliarcobacter skirrowii]MDX4060336.1 FkbM family methyltransferase [Aliarcobacter skirrowii]